ncbi:nuclear transport factor 2 family protein [Nocardioides sp. SR21]|uniref:nuclear transport factor 2 family protein n=1 Tax=Nocardioides sp. SR21 TaxID=2919501 RepID=UPI001FAB0CF5|nr:nuclear transport factor 2 family protein [Nocardioides sp. SR21]
MTNATVAVVGLGRMGAALRDRLVEQGFDTVGWTRSAAGASLADTVRGRDVVVLAVFDAEACRDVLAEIADVGVVVNTATVGPEEATELAAKANAPYVHAPVLGSVGAVAAGTLTVIAGGDLDAPGVAAVLGGISARVVTAPGVAEAAAMKLVGAAALASALDGIRTAWSAARALGVPDADAVEVLSHTAFGGLVAAKRGQLLGDAREGEVPGRADFAVGALAKDLGLIRAAATGTPPTLAAVLERAPAGSDEDVAVLALPGTGVTAPLEDYARGHATRDPAYFRRAFLPTAHIEGIRDGAFASWSLDEFTALFDGRPDPREPEFSRTIDEVRVDGSVATATMSLDHGENRFTDMFVLVRTADGWRIANKVYHRH